jgi:hypothetical protein
MCQIKMPLDAIEPLLHAIESLLHAIKAPILHRDLRLEMRKLRLQVRRIHLKAGHANLEVGNIRVQRLHSGGEGFLPTPEDVQLLHDQVGCFVDHELTLGGFDHQSHNAAHTASAPEMISISSLVIIA